MIFTATAAQATTVHQSPAASQVLASSADQTRDPPPAPIFWIPDEGSGWINFDPVESGHIIIPVVLNGEPVRALIDTGVEYLTVSKTFADAHDLPLTPWGNNISAGGPSSLYLASGFKLNIGAIRTTTAGSIVVEDLGRFSDSYLGRFDVVIGLAMLRMMEWQVDQDQHRVRMLKSGTIPIADGNLVHMGPGNVRLVTDIEVNSQHLPLAMIDTGSDDQLWLSSRIAGKIGFHAQTDMAALGIGGPIIQQIGRLKNFRMGTRAISKAYATTGDERWFQSNGIEAVIGMGALRNFNMTIDLSVGKMALSPRTTTMRPMKKSTAGIQGEYKDGRLTVVHVMKNSPAASAGLKDGDQICAIDGQSMTRDLSGHWTHTTPKLRHTLGLCDGSQRKIKLRTFY